MLPQVCHLLNTNDLVRGKHPLIPQRNSFHGEMSFSKEERYKKPLKLHWPLVG